MNRPVICLIVDNLRLRRWESEALLQLAETSDFLLLNCTNTRFMRRPVRHAFYYVLNIISLKLQASRSVPLPETLKIVDRLDFESEWEGSWQRLPKYVLEQMSRWRPQVAIKFGMGLLRVPEALECKILSYHHGDPRQFRGRPAGFYEILRDAPMVGQIVQIISNKLDAGNIVAFAQTAVRPHSYRATMANSYRLSPLLLTTAVRNCLSGNILPMRPEGKNYRLPSNWTVARFALKLLAAKAYRLFYGAFIEKQWEVARAEMSIESPDDLLTGLPSSSTWRLVHRPKKYRFLADPFPHPTGGVLVEALRQTDEQGEILHIGDDSSAHLLCLGAGHFSYPGTICTDTGCFLVPEVAEWSPPRVYGLAKGAAEFVGTLEVEGNPRLVDPTLHAQDNAVYLFANELSEGAEVLRLWRARDLFSRFSEHPQSPIRISPEGSRMAGAILRIGERLYRLGQDYGRQYGDGVIVFEILTFSPTVYGEVRLGKISFEDINGPHTLNVRNGLAVFDFYRERLTPFAGIRRLRANISKRRASRLSLRT